MLIGSLFDSSRDIRRPIEKVITYGATEEQRLRAEISEYVVTESIDEQMETASHQDARSHGRGRPE